MTPPRPDFIGIGAQKCATTWLALCLRQHPQIFMASPKELKYFNENFARGEAWYLSHFKKAGGGKYKAVGEFTSSYLYAKPARVRDCLGKVRLVVSLRNPVERFFTHYRIAIRRGLLPKRDFQHVTMRALNDAALRCPDLFEEGKYAAPLQAYLDMFGAERTHIIIKDDIDAAPQAVIKALYQFLGVDSDFVPPAVFAQIHPSFIHKHQFLQTWRLWVARAVKKHAPWAVNTPTREALSRLYRKINRDKRDLVIDAAAKEFCQEYYRDEVARLEALLDRPLPGWK